MKKNNQYQLRQIRQIISKYLKSEKFIITGSASYLISDYTPKDVDICILCNNSGNHYHNICQKIARFAGAMKATVSYQEEYYLPFDWGGRTYARIKCLQYDFFLVDKPTFDSIRLTTRALRNMPELIKDIMINKEFRVDLFRIISSNFFIIINHHQ